jgi:hypothetical protein
MSIFRCVVHFWEHCFQCHTILRNLCRSKDATVKCLPFGPFQLNYGTFLFPLLIIDIGLQQPDAKTASSCAIVSLCQFLTAIGRIDFFAALLWWWLPRDNAPTGGFDFLLSLCSVRTACLLSANPTTVFLNTLCVTWCLWDVWSGDQHLIYESQLV